MPDRGDDDARPAPGEVAQAGGRRLHVTVELRRRPGGCFGTGPERRDRPPRHVVGVGVLPHLVQIAIRGRLQIDRRRATQRRRRPGRGQELRTGPDEFRGACPYPLRVADDDMRTGRELVQQRPERPVRVRFGQDR